MCVGVCAFCPVPSDVFCSVLGHHFLQVGLYFVFWRMCFLRVQMSSDGLYLIAKKPLVPSRSSIETLATVRGLEGSLVSSPGFTLGPGWQGVLLFSFGRKRPSPGWVIPMGRDTAGYSIFEDNILPEDRSPGG